MDSKEKAMKVKMLQEILKKDFGISNAAELLAAMKESPAVDISIFVSAPKRKEYLLCPEIAKTESLKEIIPNGIAEESIAAGAAG